MDQATENSKSNSRGTGFTFRGKEIVLSKRNGRPFGGLIAKGIKKGIYPEFMRIQAATLFAATGDFELVAELSKVPVGTVKSWRKQEWFQDLLKEIREENQDRIDAKFTEIIDLSLEQLVDRVRHGDWAQNYKGELLRKPLSAKDLSLVAATYVDKRQLLRGEATSRTEAVGITETTVGRLEKLAETFENLAKFKRKPTIEITEVVYGKIESKAGSERPRDNSTETKVLNEGS